MNSQADRAEAFKSLHERPGIFAIPNPWDAGSGARVRELPLSRQRLREAIGQ